MNRETLKQILLRSGRPSSDIDVLRARSWWMEGTVLNAMEAATSQAAKEAIANFSVRETATQRQIAFNDGRANGLLDGYKKGKEEGDISGYHRGYDVGHSAGYNKRKGEHMAAACGERPEWDANRYVKDFRKVYGSSWYQIAAQEANARANLAEGRLAAANKELRETRNLLSDLDDAIGELEAARKRGAPHCHKVPFFARLTAARNSVRYYFKRTSKDCGCHGRHDPECQCEAEVPNCS